MGELVFITGGARSGKSTYAETLAMEQGHKILYIASALPIDEEMKERIKRHRESRPSFWQTLEAYRSIKARLDSDGERYHGILLECLTVMVTNLLMDVGEDPEKWDKKRRDAFEIAVMREVTETLKGIRTWSNLGMVVSNEVGMGLVPDNPLGRVFRDIIGRANQLVAADADRVFMVVSGIPVRIK